MSLQDFFALKNIYPTFSSLRTGCTLGDCSKCEQGRHSGEPFVLFRHYRTKTEDTPPLHAPTSEIFQVIKHRLASSRDLVLLVNLQHMSTPRLTYRSTPELLIDDNHLRIV